MYDEKCYELAEVFVRDDENLGQRPEDELKAIVHRLAQDIQNTIEDFLEYEKTSGADTEENEDGEDG